MFVGGLAPSVTSEGLKEFLAQFGQVMDATVMFDKETTRSKGFAFATFSDEDAVSRAMAASGIELQGKPVRVDFGATDARSRSSVLSREDRVTCPSSSAMSSRGVFRVKVAAAEVAISTAVPWR